MAAPPSAPGAARRRLLAMPAALVLLGALASGLSTAGWASTGVPTLSIEDAAQRLASGGWVLMMRHAVTDPGVGDPPGFRLDDCATQRNLSAGGRDQATRAGEAMRAAGIRVDEVRTSRWCRCRDTAQLAFGGALEWAPLDSFFAGRGDGASQAAEVNAWATGLSPASNVMLVTHQVNISAVMGAFASQGEVVAGRPKPGGIEPHFRFKP
jgi:phosphohistidine phosphatase SixA